MASDPVTEYCEACDEDKPINTGEMVVIDRTYVDHMMVSEERTFVCGECLAYAQDLELERALEARWWNRYDEWEAKTG